MKGTPVHATNRHALITSAKAKRASARNVTIEKANRKGMYTRYIYVRIFSKARCAGANLPPPPPPPTFYFYKSPLHGAGNFMTPVD